MMHTQETNRAHASGSSQALPALVLRERQRHQRYLEHRMKQLRREARRLIARDPELERRYPLMLTVPGIGETSALQILRELVVLSDTADARQWVAFSGLDPCIFTSGTSVEKRPRMSRGEAATCVVRYTCRALVALCHEPHLRAFYERLLSRGKARLQAVVAVMRKLLHALFAMFRSNQAYDGSRLSPIELSANQKAA
jgi:transposase